MKRIVLLLTPVLLALLLAACSQATTPPIPPTEPPPPEPGPVQKRVTVEYLSIRSVNSCDTLSAENNLRGTLRAFGNTVGSVNVDLRAGASANVSGSSQRVLTDRAGASFTVSGYLYEEDAFLEGSDDIIGNYSFTYYAPWTNRTETKRLSGGGCTVDLTWRITVQDE